MDPVTLISGVNSIMKLGKAAASVLSSSSQTSSSKRFDQQLALAVSQLMTSKDSDHDGSLSRTELGVDKKSFSKFDADGNGKLDANELKTWYLSQNTGNAASSVK